MGLFSSFDDIGGGIFADELSDAFTGRPGAEAARDASAIQAKQFDKIYDLYKPFTDAGVAQLGPLATGATAQGYGQNIGDILNGGSLDPLIKKRQDAATNYFAFRGLRRSGAAGKAAAEIPTDLAMQVEQELTRRRQSIAGIGQSGVGGSAGALNGIGASLAGGKLGAAQSTAQGQQNLLAAGSALLAAFSDERLKEDIEPIGIVGPLTVVRWTWNKLANAATGLVGDSQGFIAQQVEKFYPQHVFEFGGFLTINYDALLEELNHG